MFSMPTLFSRLRNVVWIAVFALLAGFGSFAAGVLEADTGLVLGFGFYGVIMAILTPKSSL